MSLFLNEFTAQIAPMRVRFSPGIRHQVGAEIDNLGCSKAVLLSSSGKRHLAEDLAQDFPDKVAGIFSEAKMHTPVDVTQKAVAYAKSIAADSIVSIGGGSTTGLGKALSWHTNLPHIVIPTTYAGSEATAVLGQTENGIKTTFSDPKLRAATILYDAELVRSLPVEVTVSSAMNAMAHAIEGLYAQQRNPISSLLALEGLRAFQHGLPQVIQNPDNLEYRGETLYGAWLCGTVLGQVGMALHHKLCHTLGGTFNLPHAETHAIILPHALAYNAQAAQQQLQPLADIFKGEEPVSAFYNFAKKIGAPLALRDYGLQQSDLDCAAELATQNPYWNPRPVTTQAIRALLQRAWEGAPPQA